MYSMRWGICNLVFVTWFYKHLYLSFWFKPPSLLMKNIYDRPAREDLQIISLGSTVPKLEGWWWHGANFWSPWSCKNTCRELLFLLKSCYQVRHCTTKRSSGLDSAVSEPPFLLCEMFSLPIFFFFLCLKCFFDYRISQTELSS